MLGVTLLPLRTPEVVVLSVSYRVSFAGQDVLGVFFQGVVVHYGCLLGVRDVVSRLGTHSRQLVWSLN